MLTNTLKDMQENTDRLSIEAKKMGLNINQNKTKILKTNSKQSNDIFLENQKLEEVTSFTYLGCIINNKSGTDEDISLIRRV